MLRASPVSAASAAAIALTVLLFAPARSTETDDGAPLLLPAEPVFDSGPGPAPAPEKPGKPGTISVGAEAKTQPGRILNGGVSHTAKRGLLHGLTGGSGNNANAAGNINSSRPGVRVNRLTSEEYRRLEYGVIGFNAELRFNFSGPVVTSVFPSCPAALAGIIPGDLLIRAGDHVFQSGEGQDVLWRVVGGKAGTPVDVTVVREGREIAFHLVRMNIEDIADDRIRDYYEGILGTYGAPGESKSSSTDAEGQP